MPTGDPLVSMQATNAAQFRDVVRALRRTAAGKELQRAMNKEIRDAAKPVVAELRAAAMTIPDVSLARRGDGDSLRRMLARATRAQTLQSGVRLMVDKRKMPAGTESMVFAIERPQGWRHPVFGGGERTRAEWAWVQQAGHPWFRPTVRRHERTFQRAVLNAMTRVIQQLETGR
jgi:hypothetical protein